MPSITRASEVIEPTFETSAAHASRAAYTHFWRTLAEIDGGAAPVGDTEAAAAISSGRRRFLGVMGASLALAGTGGCGRTPVEKIVPYRAGPSELTYGAPTFYASALARDGYGVGVLVETNMGRPTKIEGNPRHPASLGATDAITQGAVLELWDPDRSRHTRREHEIETWDRFRDDLAARLARTRTGEGFRLLTETVTSPTLFGEIAAWLQRFPNARWHQYQPINRDYVYEGGRIAYGEPVEPTYRFSACRVIVLLDADVLSSMPGSVRYARDIVASRATTGAKSRLYVAEGTPTLTGALADYRRPTRSGDIGALAVELSAQLGLVRRGPSNAVAGASWLALAAADLLEQRGASVVIAGDRQPAAVHALVHAINDYLGNVGRTVELRTPVAFETASQTDSLSSLVADMRAGEVESLLIIEANPVYHASGDLAFGDVLRRVPWKARLGLYDDETSALCTWHVHAAHPLESWGDIRAFDGTVSVQQPCIAPLYDGHSSYEVLSSVGGTGSRSAYETIRDYWRRHRGDGFEAFWIDALDRGTIDEPSGTAPTAIERDRVVVAALAAMPPAPNADALELAFVADPTVGDGRHANNAWLQELPKPLTTLTWDNAALLAPAFAVRLGVTNEDVVDLEVQGRIVSAPVWIMPGQVDGAVSLYLGNGRARAGAVGSAVGANAYPLRTASAPWYATGLTVRKTASRHALAAAQSHHRMEGRDLVRMVTHDEVDRCASSHCTSAHDRDPKVSFYPEFNYGDYRWGMSIDLSSCIGCAACTAACQAENNIAVVGKDEVRSGRELHWIRVDRYYTGAPDRPRTVFQPVPCMQCEHAPCEEVCPVGASVHDAEGLNVQVYNRCVGTRFCSNNCPYKVRRFNFFDYAGKAPGLAAQRNPEVTVRMRGVMEKCSYCVQRIANARSTADRENRRIADGEVVAACQAVCPTQAIVFGDLNDPESAVSRRKASPFDYALLAELNTRPRTTYLPKVMHPSIDGSSR